MIYFDHNATTPPLAEIDRYFKSGSVAWGNPSSLYQTAQQAKALLEEARRRIAKRLSGTAHEILFTSSGSEAINWALQGLYLAHRGKRLHVISAATEHHATLRCLRFLEREGAAITLLPVDSYGRIDPDAVRRAIRPTTLAISLMLVNNETGLIHPAIEIGKIAHEHDVFFHCDAVAAVGRLPIDLGTLGAHLVSFSGHKFYGPKGSGGLCLRKGTVLSSLIFGGGQEKGKRAGTENVPAMAGMAEALDRVSEDLSVENKRLGQLREHLVKRLRELVPDLCISSLLSESVSNTVNIVIPGLDAEMAVIAFDLHGIALSTGSACTSGATDPSHVLVAMGYDKRAAKSALRLSLGRGNSEADIEELMKVFPNILKQCRL